LSIFERIKKIYFKVINGYKNKIVETFVKKENIIKYFKNFIALKIHNYLLKILYSNKNNQIVTCTKTVFFQKILIGNNILSKTKIL